MIFCITSRYSADTYDRSDYLIRFDCTMIFCYSTDKYDRSDYLIRFDCTMIFCYSTVTYDRSDYLIRFDCTMTLYITSLYTADKTDFVSY